MKTTLPSLRTQFVAAALINKIYLSLFVITFCLGNDLYAGIKPVYKANYITKSSTTKINRSNALVLPTISYSSPKNYITGVTITPLAPTSSGVAAAAYSTTTTSVGTGFGAPRGVAVDAMGNVFVADFTNNAVKEIPVGGGATTTIGTGFNGPDGVAVDGAGNVYVSDFNNNAIKKIPVGGGATVAIGSGFVGPYGVAADAVGNVYVADNGHGLVKKIPAGSNIPVVIGTGFSGPSGVAVDAAGNVYVSDYNNSNVTKIPADGSPQVILGSGFSNPYGVGVDASGNVFVADYNHSAVKEIPVGGGAPIVIAPGLDIVTGVVVDPLGNVYASDYYAEKVYKIAPVGGYYLGSPLPLGLGFDNATGIISGTPTVVSPATNYTITAYNSSGSASAIVNITSAPITISYSSPQTYTAGVPITQLIPTSSGVAAPAYSASATNFLSGLSGPRSITMDAAGNTYVADVGNATVKKFPALGGAPVSIGSGYVTPTGVAIDAAGNVYVVDYGNNSLKKYPSGAGPAQTLTTSLNHPMGIALDAAGNIYIADNGSGWVKEYFVSTGTLTNLGSNYNAPISVALDAAGNVYFGTAVNGPIKMLPVGGGAVASLGSGFVNPYGITVDVAGNVYVTDQGSNTVKEILAGNGSVITLNSNFSQPYGIVADSKGNLLVADYNSHTIKEISPLGGYFINALPAGLTFNSATGAIGGTPATGTPATNYTVTAYNSVTNSSATVNITTVIPAPPTINYTSPQTYVINHAVSALHPVVGGVVPGFSYSKTPTVISAAQNRPPAVAVDAVGNIYVTNTNGLIQKIPVGGGTPVNLTAGSINPAGIAVDAAGNVYVSDFVNGVIRKIPVGGGSTVNAATGFNGPTGIAVDAVGNLYVAEFNASAIREVPVGGGAYLTLGSGFNHPNGVAIDLAGNIYVADSFNGAIKKIPVGGGTPVTIGSGFLGPYGVAVDASGNVFLNERDANAVKEIPVGGGAAFTLGQGFSSPYGVAVDITGNIFVADYFNNAVKEIKVVGGFYINPALPAGLSFDNSTGIISGTPTVVSPATNYTITGFNAGGNGSAILNITVNQFPAPSISYSSPKTYNPGTAIAALSPANTGGPVLAPGYGSVPAVLGSGFSLPTGVAADAVGNIYVADRSNNAVKKIPVGGGAPVIIGSGFNSPADVAVDAAGNVYVSDEGNSLIKMIPVGGGAPITIGSGFTNPFGIAVDAAGNLYIADYSNNAVKKIPAGSNVPVIIGSGFSNPISVAVDTAGNVFVADYGNNAIKKIPFGSNTPVTVSSAFNSPTSVAVDAAGNLFVVDDLNYAVKEIPVGGGAMVSFGSGFNRPFGLAVDWAGNIYIADYLNSAVKKISPIGGYYINPVLPAGLAFNNTTGVISGTPTVITPATNYNIVTYNATGADTTVLNVKIQVSVPNISYTASNSFATGTAISLAPTNTGGAVPATIYSQVSAFAGSVAGSANGTGAAASFRYPTGMASDAAGNVYVADYTNNLIRKITSAGVVTTLAGSGTAGAVDGTGIAASFHSPTGVALDAAGNVYVADAGNNLIRKITPGGVVTTFAGSGVAGSANGIGTAASFSSPHGVVVDAAGNVFVTDYSGDHIRKITPAGVVSIFAGNGAAGAVNGTGTAASFHGPFGIDIDATGNLYVADGVNNLIRKITPAAVVTTFAGSGTAGAVNGTGTAASFSSPWNLALDATGNVFVADAGNNLIRKITPAGIVTTFAGSGTAGAVNAIGTAASFNGARGLAIDPSGIIYVADYNNNLIRKITPTGYTLSPALPAGLAFDGTTGIISGTPTAVSPATNYTVTAYNAVGNDVANFSIAVTNSAPVPHISYATPDIYPTGTTVSLAPTNTGGAVPATIYSQVSAFAGSTTGAANGTGAAASFRYPCGMVSDAMGNIYVADYSNNLIRKITPAGVVTTFAGSGTAGAVNGTGTAASFHSPIGVALDAAGNVYVADMGNNLIRKITPAGVVTTFAGSGTAGSVNGTGTAASFSSPHGVAVDATGNVFVADYSGDHIRKITPVGVVTTFAGSGAAGAVNGTGTAASFNGPFGIGIDAAGNLYVADGTNNLIRKITPAAVVTTFAGSGTAGAMNGTGIAASFNSPLNLALDAAGNVFVADAGNNLIRKITPAGVVTTLAGSGTVGAVNATGTAASFNGPRGLAIDPSGIIYVADYNNSLIRKITATGYTLTPTLPTGLTFDSATGIISGMPNAASPAANYTVTAYNAVGTDVATVNITVTNSAPIPNISYATPNSFATGTAVSLAPTNTGGAVPATIYSQVSAFAGSVAGAANGTGAAASFRYPTGMASDAAGNVYVADYTNNLIRKVTPAGVVTTLAGSGTAGAVNGTGTAASFHSPTGVALDAAGNVYVADMGNNLIRKITPGGVVTTFAGSGVAGSANGTGTAASFYSPHGVVVDAAGNVFVTDYSGDHIRKITPAEVVSIFAGSDAAGAANGTGTAASFHGPFGIDIDAAGNLYVADGSNNLIRKITPAAVVTTFAGSGTAGAVNGTGTGASFNSPLSVALDAAGNVFVADAGNNLIRKITPAGVVTTLAGSGAAGAVNAIGTAASFNGARGLAIDPSGIIYVADYNNNLIRKITPTGYTLSPALPAGLAFDGTTGIISGTPTAVSPATNYTVTAYNAVGNDVANFSIAVVMGMGGMEAIATDFTTDSTLTKPTVKQGLSPNGDGFNDVLIIKNIENYPDNQLTIINSGGAVVYQVAGYDNSNRVFDGHSNKTRAMQKPGTYFYQLQYKDGGTLKTKTGYIIMKY